MIWKVESSTFEGWGQEGWVARTQNRCPAEEVLLFVAGKGDGNICYESDSLHTLSEYKSSKPQCGMCFLPRGALSVSDCEIAHIYKIFLVVKTVLISLHTDSSLPLQLEDLPAKSKIRVERKQNSPSNGKMPPTTAPSSQL